MSGKNEVQIHLPYPLFDSHFHALHMLERNAGAIQTIAQAFQSNLVGALEVAVNEKDFAKRLEFVETFSGMILSAGIHPSSTDFEHGNWHERFNEVKIQIANPHVAAIGETGLDFFRNYSPKESQEKAFADHLELSVRTGLPVIIHNRNADKRILEIIRSSNCRNGVFHCFSSGRDTAREALDLGFHISFAGNITYNKSESIREAAKIVPPDRIMLETDSPYLSPQRVRSRSNQPGYIGYTLESLAEIRGDGTEALAENTVDNARRLFGIL